MSGDFHEMIKLPDNSTIALVGDVAGKGIYAAIMLAQTLTAFRASCHLGSLPAIVAGMIEMLDDRFPDGLFVALSLVHQSADRQKVDVLNLGNPPALVVSGTTIIQQIESVGPAIGILPASFYETLSATRLSLKGYHLLVYSDGLIDINLGENVPELVDSSDIASHILPLLDLDSQAPFDRLFESLNQHPQSDDIVITCLRS